MANVTLEVPKTPGAHRGETTLGTKARRETVPKKVDFACSLLAFVAVKRVRSRQSGLEVSITHGCRLHFPSPPQPGMTVS